MTALGTYLEYLAEKETVAQLGDSGVENIISKSVTADISKSTEEIQTEPTANSVLFYVWMTQSQGMVETTGRSYDSAINSADKFAREHHIGYGGIRGTMDYMIVRETVDALLCTPEFIEINQRQNNRFRTFWLEKCGSGLTEDDNTVRKYIAHITVHYQDFVYLLESMLEECVAEQMFMYVDDCFRNGRNAVYFDALYKNFQTKFVGKCINNPHMLKSYLTYMNDGRFCIRRSYLTADANVEVNHIDEVRNYLKIAGVPVTVEDLKEDLLHIGENKIIGAVSGSNSAEFVRNRKGEYFHAHIICFTQKEIDMITELIQQAIDDKGYMGGRELTDAIEVKLPAIKERYPFLAWLGLRDVIAYKLREVFSFKGKIISSYGQDLSMSDVFAHFARSHDHFTLEQLNFLKQEMDTPIYFDSVYANSLRINQNEFVSRERQVFNVAATDVAIDRFCVGDYIKLKEIRFFGSFPDAGFPWNSV